MKSVSSASVAFAFLSTFAPGQSEAGTFVANTPIYQQYVNQTGTSLVVKIKGTANYQGVPDANDQTALSQTVEEDTRPNMTVGNGKLHQGPFVQGQVISCSTDACMGFGIIPIRTCPARYWYRGRNDAIIYHQYDPEVSSSWGSQNAVPCEPSNPGPCFANPEGRLILIPVGGFELSLGLLDPGAFLPSRTERVGGWLHLMDDWALAEIGLGSNGAPIAMSVVEASSERFSAELEAGQQGVGRRLLGESAAGPGVSGESREVVGTGLALIVGSPVHPRNERWVPTPLVRLINDSSSVFDGRPGSAVVRFVQEVGGPVSDFALLWSSRRLEAGEMQLLTESLDLEFVDRRSHRVVAFAVIELGDRLSLKRGLALTPDCCCESEIPGCEPWPPPQGFAGTPGDPALSHDHDF